MRFLPALLATSFLVAAPAAWADDAASDSIWERSNLLGDLGGLRPWATDHGVTINITEQDELKGNAAGGLKQGATFDGQTLVDIQVDAGKAFGWDGGTLNVSAINLHGRALSPYYLDNIQTASGLEGADTTRLYEVWAQQSFADGLFDVKIGQQAVDQEFISSTNGAIFFNTMMGWPVVPSEDLYAGGPASPLSSLGARLRVNAPDNFTFLLGVFDDNPPGGSFFNDGELHGGSRWGDNFSLRTGALVIGEAQYNLNQKVPGADKQPEGLPTSAKIGFYVDTGTFYDQLDNKPISGNSSVYAMIDQGIWKPAPDSGQLLSVFLRGEVAPTNQNLVDVGIDGGLTLSAPLPGRDNDIAGIGFGYTHISSRAEALDQQIANLNGNITPVRSSETFIEATYQAQVAPWLQLQPDVQYVMSPGGGIANPATGRKLGNELVLGLRSNITF
jgi:porin